MADDKMAQDEMDGHDFPVDPDFNRAPSSEGDFGVLSVAAQLAREKDTVDAFISELGPDTLTKSSVVGHGPLRDLWFLRFLIGFKWKPKVCAEKFKQMVNFRVSYGLDEIREKYKTGVLTPKTIPGYAEHHQGYVCSFDLVSGRGKKGQPISIECTPRFDFKHLTKIPLETQDVYLYHSYEWLMYVLDTIYLQTGNMMGFIKIFDLDKLSMSQLPIVNSWRKITADREKRIGCNILECYPECFEKVLVVNTPTIFPIMWKIVKPFIPPRTADKVKVESNFKKAKEKMLDLVDASVLPTFLGGQYADEWMMK